jgi:Fibronectin-attachment protein (FAP)
MDQVDQNSTRSIGLWATLAIAAVSSASAITIALPAVSNADPEPAPSPASPTAPPPGNPGTPPGNPGTPPGNPGTPPAPEGQPAPADPSAVDPNAGRIDNAVGGFSFVLPPGWVESDASHLDYGSALLSKTTGQPPSQGQPPPVANDTRIVLGRLDQKLYASAEATNPKAAVRLGSDMGEFFMPYPGTRINQETVPLNANGVTGSASYYEVKFSDPAKPNGQIWTGVIGSPAANTANAGPPQRWFVVWLGTANDPVDKGAAKALTESIRPLTAPPAPAGAPGAPAPAAPAPAAPAPAAPAPAAPAPAAPAPAAHAPAAPAPAAPGGPPAESPTPPAGAPASPSQPPAPAPAGDVTPTPAPAQRTIPA